MPHKRRKKKGPGIAPARREKKPRVLFAVGDADFAYTNGKIWRLVQRLQQQTGFEVVGVTHDTKIAEEGKKLGVAVWQVAVEGPQATYEERLLATDEIIRQTADLVIPGSRLPLWKVLAMDDFKGSLLLLNAQFPASLEADLIILPLIGVDNNTKGACGLYTWLVAKARENNIPIIGLEVSPIGNKNTLSLLPADCYAVKNAWSRDFLIRHEIATPNQVGVLRREEAYLLWPGEDEFIDAYLEKESLVQEMLHLSADQFVVFIPHHIAFLWEIRKILGVLAQLPSPLSVVFRTDTATTRRHSSEQEIARKAYDKELKALAHVEFDENIGVGLLLQLANLVISPLACTITEHAALCRKPTIICQAMGEEGWQDECIYWEPDPEKLPSLIQTWRQDGRLDRRRLSYLAQDLLATPQRVAA